ncbi:MAG: zinc-dependent alcohol dehydrogenase family protein [Rhizobiales bacterium]|nr:zinc-dependent alcohol dehydrogenase family protein [Hyphomicrobiales bacterium]
MRAALFETFRQPLVVTRVPDPVCPPDGAVIHVMACGVCRSDHHAWAGVDPDVVVPHVPGHEFAGVIAETGHLCTRWKKGDRVTAPFILACGECTDCRGGDPTVCNHQHVAGFSSWGAFAELIAVPHADFNLVRIPEALGFAETAGMGCRVTTSFRALVDRAKLQPGEWLAVHGCGGVGLSAVMIGAAMGAKVLAVDVNGEALAMARTLGASAALNVTGISDVGETVRAMTDGGAHVSLDALGVTQTFHNSIRSLRKLGRHVQIGMPVGQHTEPTLPLLETVYSRQISIMGTRGIAASRFPALLAMVEAGRIDPARLITKRIPLDEAGAAIAAMDGYTGTGITVIDRF